MTTTLLIHDDLAILGDLERGSSRLPAGLSSVDLGECDSIAEVAAALESYRNECGERCDGLRSNERIDWDKTDWLLVASDLEGN
ncbi:MAG: hypothetical protein ACYTAN_13750 [Planctomycetota bacterium]